MLKRMSFTFCNVVSLPTQILNCQVQVLQLLVLGKKLTSLPDFSKSGSQRTYFWWTLASALLSQTNISFNISTFKAGLFWLWLISNSSQVEFVPIWPIAVKNAKRRRFPVSLFWQEFFTSQRRLSQLNDWWVNVGKNSFSGSCVVSNYLCHLKWNFSLLFGWFWKHMFHVSCCSVAAGNEVIYISHSFALSPLAAPTTRYFDFGLNQTFQLSYLQTLHMDH